MQSLAMVSKCADMASHLSVPALPGLHKAPPAPDFLHCLHSDEVVVGPEGLHVGLEMGVDPEALHPHPSQPPPRSKRRGENSKEGE